MSIRQAKCQHCNLPTGESYDTDQESFVEALCPMCKTAARAGALRDPGKIIAGRAGSMVPEREPRPGGEYDEDQCPSCGGTEFEIEWVTREYGIATTHSHGETFLSFEHNPSGYSEVEAEGSPFCTGCGDVWEGDWELN